MKLKDIETNLRFRGLPSRGLAALALILAGALLCAGCSGRKAPEPPKTKPELLLEIYSSIEKNDHKGALNKILRMHEIDKNSVFLTELESIERNNMYLVETRRLLDAGDIDGAANLLDGAIKRHGQHEELMEAKAAVAALAETSSLIDALNHPKSAAQLKACANKLLHLGGTFKPAAAFAPFAQRKIAEAGPLEEFETQITLFDLSSDADILIQSGNPDAALPLAELALEAPKSPALKRLLANIKTAPGARQKLAKK